jgi:hypothetical protein
MLAFLAALMLTFVGLGWYLDWYNIRSIPADSVGHRSVTVDINAIKIGADLHKAEEKVQQKLAQRAKKSAEQADKKPPRLDLPEAPTAAPKLDAVPGPGTPIDPPKVDKAEPPKVDAVPGTGTPSDLLPPPGQ